MSALHEVLAKVGPVRKNGDNFMARCPAATHGGEDRNPSLSIKEGDDGQVLFKCFAGCAFADIVTGLEMAAKDMMGDTPSEEFQSRSNVEWTPHGDATAVYDYRDEAGQLLFQVLRTADKQFPQRTPDPTRKSGWNWRLGDTRRVLYRLPKLIEGIADGKTVWIVEGEKDVHNLERNGALATCNPGGAGKWREDYTPFLTDADVVICADRDKPGQAHARAIALALTGVAHTVRIVEAADPHKDISEHLAANLTLEDVVQVSIDDAVAVTDLALGINDFLDAADDEFDWVIPDLLERGDRLMLTGFEGGGKSTMLRQLAVCFAAGLHPFTQVPTRPVRVLLIDCENSARQTRRKLRPLRDLTRRDGHKLNNDNLRVIVRSDLDLLRADDAAWLLERVLAHRPDVLVIGPLYKMHAGSPTEELPARKVVAAIDAARAAVGCAVVMEHHAGHGSGGQERSVRPFGASLWLRWPEFGYGLKPVPQTVKGTPMEFLPWRGPREERGWPEWVAYGGMENWPWVATTKSAYGGPFRAEEQDPWAPTEQARYR